MAAPSLNESELRFLRVLRRRKVRFMVVGLSAAAFMGWRHLSKGWRNCVDVSVGRHKLKVLRVDRILVSKRAANRAKDRLVIPLFEDSLEAGEFAARRGARKSS